MALEVCVDNIQSALNATDGGAKRIELCSALHLGGLTPTVGLLKVTKKLLPPSCAIFVMIRPNSSNDFIYEEADIEVMVEDIKVLKENGADGFVFGCLTKEKNVDVEACRKLLEASKNYPCTFHRAFDVVRNPEDSLVTLSDLGFSRILTSGQKKTAYLGKEIIRGLVLKVKELNSRIVIMAGGGIDPSNLNEILTTTNVTEFHGSARCKSVKELQDLKDKTHWVTNQSVVREMIEIANKMDKLNETQ